MAWAEEQDNGLYRGVYRNAQGRQRSKSGFKQKAAAKRWASEQEAKARRGEAVDIIGRSPTWNQWKDDWLALRRVEPGTRASDDQRIRRHIAPQWGKVRIAAIERDDVQAWVNELDDNPDLAAGTVRRIFATFSASMKDALVRGKIPANPCSLVTLPAVIEAHERYFTRAEFDRACFHLEEPWRTAVIVLVGTGLRVSELAGLHWQRVDFEQALLYVAETWDGDRGEIKPFPKSKKPRPVPFPAFVRDALAARLEANGHSLGTTCGYRHRGTSLGCRTGLVVTDPDGTPLDRRVLLRGHWKPALRRAGVEIGRVHDLRHTWASWARQGGVDQQVVQEIGGWADGRMTQRYTHFGDTAHANVRAALDRLNGRPPTV